jgi:3-hydroxyisobutyrate dehydrogenase
MNSSNPSPARVGFIGLGIMGRSMAGHLLAAGHPLAVYNRSRASADALVAQGARWCNSPAEVAQTSDVVITIVGYPSDVEQVWLGADGIVAAAAPQTLLIDMTTSSPALARRLAQAAAERGCEALDAPVSGGDVGARDAKLSIMVGGGADAYARALPVFQRMGANIARLGAGGAGAGQHTKMCNQIVIASTVMGVSEGLAYARAAGLDLDAVLKVIGGGAASGFQLNVIGAKMAHGDFAPGFFIEHFVKDLGIALQEAQALGLDLPGLALARQLYGTLIEQGHGRLGTQALFQRYGS